MLLYSQTMAFAWDEGFHLLAAQLILRGKRPYLDFLFSQTPLIAYWNAGWMALLGETWRAPHAMAALMTVAAVFLAAGYLWRHFPIPHWRFRAALVCGIAFGLNPLVVSYGALAQAYGLCLVLIVAAFRLSLLAVGRRGILAPFAAGLLSGAEANCSLLTAPAPAVLFAWGLVYERAGRRLPKAAAFAAGVLAAFLPLLWLFAQSPRNVIFGVLKYNLFFREVQWEGVTDHNIGVFLSWIDSADALLLLVLAAAGLIYVRDHSGWASARRAEFYLCLWMAVALAVHVSLARPTFERYYLFVVPFLSIPSAAGLYWIATRFEAATWRFRPVAAVSVLVALALAKALFTDRDDFAWHDLYQAASTVNRVTPHSGSLLADESIYFLTRRIPPEGMELADSHKLELPESVARRLHVVSNQQLQSRVRSGEFDTVETCWDEDVINELGLNAIYAQHTSDMAGCSVYWDRHAGAGEQAR
jgi:hypothetical protein